jgi:hypothetical protein
MLKIAILIIVNILISECLLEKISLDDLELDLYKHKDPHFIVDLIKVIYLYRKIKIFNNFFFN